MKNSIKYLYLSILSVFLLFGGCTIRYTASGAFTGDAKTFSVKYFPNNARLIAPSLSQIFTDALKDKFIADTKLVMANSDGDLHFEGEIIEYETAPLAIQENDIAAQNRLTIGVKVKFTNKVNNKFDFETTFRRFADYESTKQLSEVEDDLIEGIVKELVEDVFNKSVVNW